MSNIGSGQAGRRMAAYGALLVVLLAGALPLHRAGWHASPGLHTVLEAIAALLALAGGAIALIRFDTGKSNVYPILGSGLVGAALLDGYHAVVTSTLCDGCTRPSLAALTPWSGVVSSLFLSLVMCACWFAGKREKSRTSAPVIAETRVYILVGLFTVSSFLFFGLAPLPPAYYPAALVHRPAELIAGALFTAALLGFLGGGAWKTGGFEHWRILFLITAAMAHSVYMPFSAKLYDASYIFAHLLKILGYVFVLSGLFQSIYMVFKSEAGTVESLQKANQALAHEMEERRRAEDALRVSNDELEERVAGRTAELTERSRLATMAAEVGAVLGRGDDMHATLQRCAEIVVRQLDAAFARIWIIRPGEKVLRLQASAGLYTHLDGPHGSIPVGTKRIGMIAERGEPTLTNEVIGDPLVDQEWARSVGVAGFAGYPLTMEGRAVGVVAVFSQRRFSEHAFKALASLASEISLGIARRQAERETNVSRERFRIAAANAGDLVWEWDPATDLIRYFGAGNRPIDLGAVPGTLDGLRRMLHPDDLERVMGSLEGHRATGEPLAEEYRIHRGGEIRYWSSRATLLRDAEAGSEVWIGVSSDVTEKKHREAAASQLAAIVECSDAAIMSVNSEGIFETWNGAAERIFGYTAEEIIGKHSSIILPPECAGDQDASLWSITTREASRDKETVRMAKSGERIEVMMTVSPLPDSSGAMVSVAAIMSDITQRKQLERQLAQGQKLESIGQLAAGIAHEINTPIQFIGDNVQFLSDSFAELDALLQSYQELREAARLGTVAGDLLAAVERREELAEVDYLRSEIPKSMKQSMEGIGRVAAIAKAIREFSHPGSSEKIPVDLNSAVESTALVSRNEWKYVAELKTELDRDLPAVCCVPGELNQVILNLIVNAAHAIADKPSCSPGSKGLITVSTRKEGDWAELRVSDTGTGIPDAVRSNVFNPFFTTKPVGKGTGQGLAIAHTVIVKKHRGTVRFETELGVGTTFIIRLPVGEVGRETVEAA